MFNSVDETLNFAFRTLSGEIVKMSSINRMRGASGNSELSPHDMHAQAAMIVSVCEQVLDPYERAVIVAKYAGVKGVQDTLSNMLIAQLETGAHSKRGVIKLCISYFEHQIGTASMRADFGITDFKVRQYKNMANKIFRDLVYRAEILLDAEFRRAGLVVGNDEQDYG